MIDTLPCGRVWLWGITEKKFFTWCIAISTIFEFALTLYGWIVFCVWVLVKYIELIHYKQQIEDNFLKELNTNLTYFVFSCDCFLQQVIINILYCYNNLCDVLHLLRVIELLICWCSLKLLNWWRLYKSKRVLTL